MSGALVRCGATLLAALLVLGCLPASWPRPEPAVLLLAAGSPRWGREFAVWLGLLAAVMYSLCTALNPLTSLGVFTSVGWILGSLGQDPEEEGPLLPLLLTLSGTVLVAVLLTLFWAAGLPGPGLFRLQQWLPPTLVMNVVFCGPTVLLLRRWGTSRRPLRFRV